MSDLRVTIENICVFVLTRTDAEAWFIEDPLHRPILNLAGINHSLASTVTELDLTGAIVRFGTQTTAGVTPVLKAPSYLGGNFQDRLIDLQQIFPSLLLETGWTFSNETSLAPNMAARVFLRDGELVPKELTTPGGSKIWQIGAKVSQQLVNESEYVYAAGASTPVILIHFPGTGTRYEWPIQASADGHFRVKILAKNTSTMGTLEFHHGVVFVTEFAVVDKCLNLGSHSLAIPYTHWPNYPNQTDPNGGPCPGCVLNLMEQPPALIEYNRRRLVAGDQQ